MPVGKNYTITADSTPDYDDWGVDDYWGPDEWIQWHKLMKAKYGADDANKRFIIAYQDAGFGAVSFDWRTFNDNFKQYAKDNGFFDALYDGIGGLIGRGAGLLDTTVETGTKTATTVIESAGSTISTLAKSAKWVIPAVVIVVIIIAGVIFYRNAKAITGA